MMKTQHTMLFALCLSLTDFAWAQQPVEKTAEPSPAKAPSVAPAEANTAKEEPAQAPAGEAPAQQGEGSAQPEPQKPVAAAEAEAGDAAAPDSEASAEASVQVETPAVAEKTPSAELNADELEAESSVETTPTAVPENVKKPINPDAIPALRGALRPTQHETIGLQPGAPQAVGITGGVTPAFGTQPSNASDWAFDIHGFLLLPLRIGFNKRDNPGDGQKVSVLHTPPVVPGDFQTFEYSGVNPDPWAQLNFSYGNKLATATIIIAARTVSNANSYFNPADQLGINDAFITFHPDLEGDFKFRAHVGAFANRYGIMGEYDMGRYGTPVIARVSGVGATGTGTFQLGEVEVNAEAGVMGPLNKAPVGVEPAGWNGFTDPNAGTTFAVHGHLAAGLSEEVTLGAHVIHSFARDDRATTTDQKDGRINVFGVDMRASMRRYGHLFLGYGLTDAKTARSVSNVVRVLNAPGGLGLMEEYFGLESEGTGKLHTFGAQYDMSLGNLLRYPQTFNGKAPDLVFSAFTMGTAVESPVPEFDGVFKFKYGAEATYSFLRWMGAGLRYDRVMPDTSDASQTHAILSPRLIFKSDWASRDQVILQYSRYFNGSNTAVVDGYPPEKDRTIDPDSDVVSLTASIWW